ncbi:hypothetical protein MCHIJ_12170 [Mycolicibacterium chitae]|uniref:Protein of uncharacterized function (DUF2910) n=1 Tax=Mycolicibacterium chitae TaxID=1792 RepID=A0A448IDQ5_MYCCI|nr:GAP family protein [Mycolicibacterium chitae]MCV7106034.1 GAP family protein [Mycolicibacterium chitae]BBZ01780.1 hypothetical protein MCHIJ_12170 [Mycolicibacterium chitae]VEG50612.1 Protein of uncharacterised function (DUF2910) [Mycolicibacterium chitae]
MAAVLGSVLAVAVLGNLNPVRLGVVLLLVTRPRPTQNLIAFWIGCLTATSLSLTIPLLVLNLTPMFEPVMRDLADSAMGSTVGKVQIGLGVLLLLVGAFLTARLRSRRKSGPQTARGELSFLDPNSTRVTDHHSADAGPATTTVRSVLQRVLAPARNGWNNGALWIACVIGLVMGPAPEMILLVLAIIVTSGATVGAQVSAVIAYALVLLALVETVLVGSLLMPARTEAVLQRLRSWTITHRRQILVAIFTVAGASTVLTGISRV